MKNKTTFCEKFDLTKAKKIYSNWDKLFNDNDGKQQLFNLIINHDKPVEYNFSKNKKTFGRLYGNGLQSTKRIIRGTICDGLMYDYDMINSQPSFLYEYCIKNHISADTLKEYCTNREKYYHLKQSIIELLNGANMSDHGEPDTTFLLKLNEEFGIIQNFMKTKDKKGCQEYLEIQESNVLMKAVELIKSKYISLQFDGFMTDELIDVNLLNSLSFAKWKIKEHSTLIIPDDYLDTFEEFITDGENQSSKMFLKLLGDTIKFCDDVYYMKKDGIWMNNFDSIKRELTALGLQAGFRCMTALGPLPYSSQLTNCKKMIEATLAIIPESPNFIDELFNSTLGKICWNNGYYNFKTKKFTDNFDDISSTIKIHRDFPKRNEDHIKELNDKLLNPIYGDLKINALQFLSQSLAGICKKNWCVMMGERNSGKTKITQMLNTAFEKYITEINADNFLFEKSNGNDKAKKLSWMKDLEFSRLSFSSEIKIDQTNNQKIDGVILKSIASGGDKIQIRQNYTNERLIRVQSTVFLNCNDIGTVTPTDTYETMTPFSLPNKFVKEEELDSRYPFMLQCDSTIDDFVKRTEIGDALFWVLADNYIDNYQMNDNQIAFKDQFLENDEFKMVNDSFMITTKKENIVMNEDIEDYIQNNRLNMTKLKLKEYLKKRGAEEYRNTKKRGLSHLVLIKNEE